MLELDEDTVAIEAWKRVGIPPERIVRLGKDNFWQAPRPGPCGPCSEIFYDRGDEHGCGRADCRPGCECDRYMEFYNLVFMQYDLRPGNELVPLPTQNVDTGLGPRARRDDAPGRRLELRHRRLPADHGLGRAASRASPTASPARDEGAPRARRPRPRDVVPDRRRRHARRTRAAATSAAASSAAPCSTGSASASTASTGSPPVVIEQMGDAYPELREHADEIERVVQARGGALPRDARARAEGVRGARAARTRSPPTTRSRSRRRTASRSS